MEIRCPQLFSCIFHLLPISQKSVGFKLIDHLKSYVWNKDLPLL